MLQTWDKGIRLLAVGWFMAATALLIAHLTVHVVATEDYLAKFLINVTSEM